MNGREERWMDVGLLLLRLGFGLGFLYFHGWAKITGGPEMWANVGGAVEHLGIGFGHTFFGFMAGFAEAVGGILIAIGFLFRPAAILIAITMFVAWVMHISTGQPSPAHPFKNFWVAVGLALIGPGRYSVDAWLRSRQGAPEIAIPTERKA